MGVLFWKRSGQQYLAACSPAFHYKHRRKAEAFHFYRVYKQSECLKSGVKMLIFAFPKIKVGAGKWTPEQR